MYYAKVKLPGTTGPKRVAINMSLFLNQEQMDYFQMVKAIILNCVKLHFLVDTAVVCIVMNASLHRWTVVVAQVVERDSA